MIDAPSNINVGEVLKTNNKSISEGSNEDIKYHHSKKDTQTNNS